MTNEEVAMKRYKELYIICSEMEARSFFVRVSTVLRSPQQRSEWKQDNEAMENMKDDFCFKNELFICISMLDYEARPEALVTLVFDGRQGQIWLSNIVPCRVRQLNIEEYNSIFDRVFHQVIHPS